MALETGIHLKEPGIPLVIGIRNLSSANKNPESSTRDPKSTVWNPESKIVFPYKGRGSPHLVGLVVLCVLSTALKQRYINRNQEYII